MLTVLKFRCQRIRTRKAFQMNNTLRIVLVFLVLSVANVGADPAAADDTTSTGWKRSLIFDLTTSQTAYSDSWVGGEAGSVNWVSNLNGTAEKQLSNRLNYRSILRLSFGQTLIQDPETKDWSKPRKSTDLIDWENLGRLTLGGLVDPYAALRIESQFYDGKLADKKLFFSPIKITESAGIAKVLYSRNDDQITSRLGLGLRQIIKTVILDTISFATQDSTLTDGGLEWVSDATLSFHKNLRYTGKLTLYKAFFFSESDRTDGTEFENDWKAVDVNWENIIAASITKIVTVNMYTQLLYDKEVSRKGRFKQTLAIGIVIKMI